MVLLEFLGSSRAIILQHGGAPNRLYVPKCLKQQFEPCSPPGTHLCRGSFSLSCLSPLATGPGWGGVLTSLSVSFSLSFL